jgi:hypothetical protein
VGGNRDGGAADLLAYFKHVFKSTRENSETANVLWIYYAGFENLSSLAKTQPSKASYGQSCHPEQPVSELTL